MHSLFLQVLPVSIKGKGFDGQSSEANSDHLYHELIEDIHILLVRTIMHQPLRRLTSQRCQWITFRLMNLYTFKWGPWSIDNLLVLFIRQSSFLLLKITLCFLVQHVIIIIFGNNALDLPISSIVELEEDKELLEHAGIERTEFVGFVGCVDLAYWVLSEFVVEIYVPSESVHLNIIL